VIGGGESSRSGDFALADSTGTVILPAEKAESILAVAEQLWAREFAMAGDFDGRCLGHTVMGHAYERMLTS